MGGNGPLRTADDHTDIRDRSATVTIKLATLLGGMVINVWASWRGPCRAEMALRERLGWHEQAKAFSMIGISTDDDPDRAVAVLRRSNATIGHFVDFRLELEHMLGASSILLTVLVDAQGRVLEKVVGAKEWEGPEALRFIGKACGNAALMQAR